MKLYKGDLKEGESICRKCKGTGESLISNNNNIRVLNRCQKCLGRGVVDWVTQAVERPPLMTGLASSSSHSLSSGMAGTSGISYKPVKNIPMPGNICMKSVTNYKRRIGV